MIMSQIVILNTDFLLRFQVTGNLLFKLLQSSEFPFNHNSLLVTTELEMQKFKCLSEQCGRCCKYSKTTK